MHEHTSGAPTCGALLSRSASPICTDRVRQFFRFGPPRPLFPLHSQPRFTNFHSATILFIILILVKGEATARVVPLAFRPHLGNTATRNRLYAVPCKHPARESSARTA